MSSTPSATASKRGTSSTASNPAVTPSRSPTRQIPQSSNVTGTPARASSVRAKGGPPPSAKAAAKRNSVISVNPDDEEARAETSALIEDLKEQLRKTETASEDYLKQLQVAQSRLDEALAEQTKLEETVSQHAATVASLEVQLRDNSRQRSDLEAERDASESGRVQEREAAAARESELGNIIQRLKDTIAQRDPNRSAEAEASLSGGTNTRSRSFANPEKDSLDTPSLERRNSSQHNAQLVIQKDRVIEELRLELAEAHVKVMEVDRAGGGRLQKLEQQLLEVRMSNAKLMEDNESYQYLLQERTLNGEFANRFRAASPSEQTTGHSNGDGSGNLADELETADVTAELEDAKERLKVDKEMASLKEQNRAMQLYIDKIIGKILASDHYEAIFNGNPDATRPIDTSRRDSEAGKENAAPSLLQRAGSIFGNRTRPTRPSGGRSVSGATDSSTIQEMREPLPNEDPNTAPSVPFRGAGARHTRVGSDQDKGPSSARFTTRTPSGTNTSNRRPSTPVDNTSASRQASFSGSTPPANGVIQEDNDSETATSGMTSDTTLTETTEMTSNSGPSSPPRSLGGASSTEIGSRPTGGAAVFSGSGKQMRPLRLVQERAEADAERKKANRGSWVGWLNNKAANFNTANFNPTNFNPLASFSETSSSATEAPSNAPAAASQGPLPPTQNNKPLPQPPSASGRPGSSGGSGAPGGM